MRKIACFGVALAALVTAACNTVSGVGRDLTAAGSAISGSAENARR